MGGTTVKSDKGTFGNIPVPPDGSIIFTSGAPELKSGSYNGTGAQVHMKDAAGTQLACGWTLDNDVTGTEGSSISRAQWTSSGRSGVAPADQARRQTTPTGLISRDNPRRSR